AQPVVSPSGRVVLLTVCAACTSVMRTGAVARLCSSAISAMAMTKRKNLKRAFLVKRDNDNFIITPGSPVFDLYLVMAFGDACLYICLRLIKHKGSPEWSQYARQ